MADFARQARDMGVTYIGICCGAGPHHVRAMAEALGRTPPASRYSPDLSLHPMIGAQVAEHDRPFLKEWKD
jgi:betaine-homocysteine S-methyltransferase